VRYRAIGLCAAVVLTACGGGGGHTLPAAAPSPTAAPLGSARIALTIPNRITPSSERRAQYVSSSTQSVQFTANPGAVQTTVNLTGSNCVENAQSTGKVCTFPVSAPIGNVTFSMIAYDQLNGSGNALSAASNFSATIAEGKSNTLVPIIMGGIPNSIVVHYADGTMSAILDGAVTKPLTIDVYDADNNIIVAPGAFVNGSGVATPIVFTSTAANTHLGYTYTPAATGVTGAITNTISFAEPDDTVTFSYDGTAYVPASDTFAYPAIPSGATNTQFTFGWLKTPPFTPTHIASLTSSAMGSLGHQGVLIADGSSHLGFVGDASGSCSIPRGDLAGAVSQIGGITADANASDTNLYASVDDGSLLDGDGYDQLSIPGIINSTCTVAAQQTQILSLLTPAGVAAAGGFFYGAGTSSFDLLFTSNVPGMTSQAGGFMNGGSLFGTAAVASAPNGSSGYVQFAEKQAVAQMSFAIPGEVVNEAPLVGSVSDPYPYGLTVDASGNVYANDTGLATYGSNGGVDSFTNNLTLTGRAQLHAGIVTSGPAGAIENMAVATYHGSQALFVACTDGIEVFALPLTTTPSAPTATITPAASAVSIVANGDGRIWAILSTGRLEALPAI